MLQKGNGQQLNSYNDNTIKSENTLPTTTATTTTKRHVETTEFRFPACWQDEQRMSVLLATFRPRQVNAESYDAKMKFWQDLIADYLLHKGKANFCKQDLLVAFAHGARTPHCLDEVLANLQSKKQIRARAEYENDPLNNWRVWTVQTFVRTPLAWSVHKLKSSIGLTDDISTGLLEFVHLPVLQQFCQDLHGLLLPAAQQQCNTQLLPYAVVQQQAKDALHLTELCLQLCLLTLDCQKKIAVLRSATAGIQLIKLTGTVGASNCINETDVARYNLQLTQQCLLQQLHEMQEQMQQLEQQARVYVMQQKMQLAKTYLRRKRLLEVSCVKRSNALHNIETMLFSMDEALSNGVVFDAFKIGSKSLQNILQNSQLTADNVDDVVHNMSDVLEMHKEVQDALANVEDISISGVDVDDDELVKELDDLLQNEQQQQREQAQLCLQNGQYNNKKTKLAAATVAASTADTANDNDVAAGIVGQPKEVIVREQALLAAFAELELEDATIKQSADSQGF